MMSMPLLMRLLLACWSICLISVSSTQAAGFLQVPAGVTSRVRKIDEYMAKVETALLAGKADHNNLERAQVALDEIYRQYKQYAEAPEVKAAAARIEKGREAIARLEAEKAAKKESEQKEQRSADAIAEEWAAKMEAYKADTKPGSKGNFGVPSMDPALIVANRPNYLEAKALHESFLKTGIDKDSHWRLRQAEWDLKAAILNYDQSVGNVLEDAKKNIQEAADFLASQRKKSPPLNIPSWLHQRVKDHLKNVQTLLEPTDPRRTALEAQMAEVDKNQAEIDKILISSRRMKPDAFKGAESAAIKAVAKSVVSKEHKDAKILRVHIVSSTWNTESAVEWTDTTKTAVQHRVTKGVTVQVAVKKGADCIVYSLFVHKDTIGGATGGLTGHIMYFDKMLEANLPKG